MIVNVSPGCGPCRPARRRPTERLKRAQERKPIRASHGFTLVELLVVIGIIGVLTAILLPALNKVILAAHTAACLSNVRQISLAIQMYASDNRGGLPRFAASQSQTTFAQGTGGAGTKWPHDWTWLVFPYLGHSGKALECPARYYRSYVDDSFTADDGNIYSGKISYRVNGAAFNDGVMNSAYPPSVTYLTSQLPMVRGNDRPFGPIWQQVSGNTYAELENTLKISNVSGDTAMLADCIRRDGNVGTKPTTFERSCYEFGTGADSSMCNVSTSSHDNKNASVAFFDGHCELVSVQQFLSLKNGDGSDTFVQLTADTPQRGNSGDMQFVRWNNSTYFSANWWTAASGD